MYTSIYTKTYLDATQQISHGTSPKRSAVSDLLMQKFLCLSPKNFQKIQQNK